MKMRFLLIGLVFAPAWRRLARPPLTESTFTEIIRQANVVAAADKAVTPAARTRFSGLPTWCAPDRLPASK